MNLQKKAWTHGLTLRFIYQATCNPLLISKPAILFAQRHRRICGSALYGALWLGDS